VCVLFLKKQIRNEKINKRITLKNHSYIIPKNQNGKTEKINRMSINNLTKLTAPSTGTIYNYNN